MQSIRSELLVSVDVGCYRHAVAIGLSDGQVLDEFEVDYDRDGFKTFFDRIDQQEQAYELPVLIPMEGYNGHARPLDRLVRARNYRLFNINNLKLARFKEIFPAAAETDVLDPRKGLELFQLRHLPRRVRAQQSLACADHAGRPGQATQRSEQPNRTQKARRPVMGTTPQTGIQDRH